MVPQLRRRWLSVSSLAFAGWARRFRRAGNSGTTVAWSVSGRIRRHDVAQEYGARTAKEPPRLTLIRSGRMSRPSNALRQGIISDRRFSAAAKLRRLVATGERKITPLRHRPAAP